MDDKLLTLIVPSYNMERYLPKCCKSVVLEDTLLMSRLEVLIINDGSRDRTSEIGHDFERLYPGVFRVIDKLNGHYGSCVNCGIKEATGKFVKLLDADDTFENGSFGKLMAFLDGHEKELDEREVDLVITDHSDVHEDDKVYSVIHYPGVEGFQTSADFISHDMPMHPSMMAVRTEMLHKIGYYQTEGLMYTDLEWGTYPMEGIRNVWYFPVILYRYLHGREGQSISPIVASRNVKVLITLLKRFCEVYTHGRFVGDKKIFLRRKISSVARQVVVSTVFNAPAYEIDSNLQAVGACIAGAAPDVEEDLDKLYVFSRHPYYYYKVWKKCRHINRFVLAMLRCYSLLVNRK